MVVSAVCDDTCREAVLDPTNELLVCTISGHCFDRLLSPAEMEPDPVSKSFPDSTTCFQGSSTHLLSKLWLIIFIAIPYKADLLWESTNHWLSSLLYMLLVIVANL